MGRTCGKPNEIELTATGRIHDLSGAAQAGSDRHAVEVRDRLGGRRMEQGLGAAEPLVWGWPDDTTTPESCSFTKGEQLSVCQIV